MSTRFVLLLASVPVATSAAFAQQAPVNTAGADPTLPAAQNVPPAQDVPLAQRAGQPNAQGTTFQTPGMSGMGVRISSGMGQVTRFSSEFNPAFSFIVDSAFDAVDSPSGRDGADVMLRSLEIGANSWVDPNAWAYFVAVADEETVNLEEAAVHYTGFGSHDTIRAGRFFIDFGKQMQTHVHELRTVERPLVLRTYLGDEVKGDGVQWDSWTTVGDSTALRWSLGAFATAVAEEGSDFDPATTPAFDTLTPRHAKDFTLTGRITGFTDVGDNGTFQFGASARALPRYSYVYEPDGTVIDNQLSNTIFGLDATYGWVGDSGLDSFSCGAELLANSGDNGAQIVDPDGIPGNGNESFNLYDQTVVGWFGWADYAWDKFNSVGAQYCSVELPDATQSNANEFELYYSRMFSEFHRLRFAVSHADSDLDGESNRLVVQYTAVLGAHGHGVNW